VTTATAILPATDSPAAAQVLHLLAESATGRLPEIVAQLRTRSADLAEAARRPLRLAPQQGLNLREWLVGTLDELRDAATHRAIADTLEAFASGSEPPAFPSQPDLHAQAAAELPGVFAATIDRDPVEAIAQLVRLALDHAQAQLEPLDESLTAIGYLNLANIREFNRTVAELERHAALDALITRLETFAAAFVPALAERVTAVLADDQAVAKGLASSRATALPEVDSDPELVQLQSELDSVLDYCRVTEEHAAAVGLPSNGSIRQRRVTPLQNAIQKRRSQLEAERRELLLMAGEALTAIPQAAKRGDGEALWTIVQSATARPGLFPNQLADGLRTAIAQAISECGCTVFAELFAE
jgi:hypothetical protein